MEIDKQDILKLENEDCVLHEILQNLRVSYSHLGVKYDFSYFDFANKTEEKRENFSKYRRRLSNLYRFSTNSLSSIKRKGIAINSLDRVDSIQVKFASLLDTNIPWTTVYKIRALRHKITDRIISSKPTFA